MCLFRQGFCRTPRFEFNRYNRMNPLSIPEQVASRDHRTSQFKETGPGASSIPSDQNWAPTGTALAEIRRGADVPQKVAISDSVRNDRCADGRCDNSCRAACNRCERGGGAIPPEVGAVVWLTGVSGAGKSTLARGASEQLKLFGVETQIIDGDVLRNTICRDLGFSTEDRMENIRRAGDLAVSCAQEGRTVFVALISPIESARRAVEAKCRDAGVGFACVFVDAPLECCERRDCKGLYKLARAGKIPEFTGINSPYEPPTNPTLTIKTSVENEWDSAQGPSCGVTI
jgi:adenylylsulfate kinase